MAAVYNNIKRSYIAQRLIIAIVLFSSSITLITTSLQIYSDYEENLEQINIYLQMIETSQLDSLTKSVWQIDEELIQLQLDGLLQLPSVERLEIIHRDEVHWSSGERQSEYIVEKNYPLEYTHLNRQHSIGSLTIVVSLSKVYYRLFRRAITILISNAVKTFLVAGFILFIFQYYVTRHLTGISRHVHDLEINNDIGVLKLKRRRQKKRRQDELDQVVAAINRMQLNLKQAFDDLQESETRFRAFVETSNDLVWAIDRDNNYTYASPALKEILGYEPHEIIGKDSLSIISKREEKEARNISRKIMAKPQSFKGIESATRHRNGNLVTLESSGAPIFDTDQNFIGYQGIARNVTERKISEKKLEEYRLHLEDEVKKRTLALETANKELEAFAYSVSHDLRAPLRTLDGFSLALLEDYGERLDDQGKDYLNRVRAGSQRMGNLIDDMLKLSRLTRGEMQYQAVDLTQIATGILEELKAREPERQVELILAQDQIVTGDKTLLTAALSNLLNNAWKFTSKTIDATIEFGIAEKKNDSKTTYFIRDNGAGFDQTYVEKIFGAFQRLHTANEFPGTGIGLAIVQRVIHRHDGRVWAEGSVENGATFYFTLSTATDC